MDNFNRVVSFVLGLIVVVVFLIIISRRFGWFSSWFGGRGSVATASITPTPSPIPDSTTNTYMASPTPAAQAFRQVTPVPGTRSPQGVNNIPNTGAETALLPFALSGLGAGIYLRRKK